MSGPRVTTTAGVVEGTNHDGFQGFLGIPYTRPPVGALRFRAPEPAAPWREVLATKAFSPHVPQTSNPFFFVDGAPVTTSESECLTLNVWTPKTDEAKRPVMVWIHGGAYAWGGSSTSMYDGERFAIDHDVVIVSFNYRLGVLGFTYLGNHLGPEFEGSGSLAIQDAAAALRWVGDNITSFGGDPRNVTIFGKSAGAGVIGTLFALPAARGLFHKAILQSGAGTVIGPEEASEGTARLLKILEIPNADVTQLQELPVEVLLDAFTRLSGGGSYRLARPVVDGEVLADVPLDAVVDGAVRDVPMLIGTNQDEWRLWTTGLDPESSSMDENALRAAVAAMSPQDLDLTLATYRRRLGDC